MPEACGHVLRIAAFWLMAAAAAMIAAAGGSGLVVAIGKAACVVALVTGVGMALVALNRYTPRSAVRRRAQIRRRRHMTHRVSANEAE